MCVTERAHHPARSCGKRAHRRYAAAFAVAALLQLGVRPVVAAQVQAAQNPSPMTETTRAHERLTRAEVDGVQRTFKGPADRPVELLLPPRPGSQTVDLVIHFHGSAWLPHQAVAAVSADAVAAVVNLGAGSTGYDRAFRDPAAFDALIAGILREASAAAGRELAPGRITLTAFSAGHGAVRAILRDPRYFRLVDAVLLLDGMHTSYVPERTVLADGAALDTADLVAFADFARAAVRGEKRFVITHSAIFPGTFASTTETADWLLAALGLRRVPVLRWGPRGMQQLSEATAGGFEMLGYAGNSAPDHVDHLHAMPELLARALSAGPTREGRDTDPALPLAFGPPSHVYDGPSVVLLVPRCQHRAAECALQVAGHPEKCG